MTAKPWLNFYGPRCPHEITPPEKTMNQVFADTVAKWPQRDAIVFTSQAAGHLFYSKMTYAQLDAMSDRLALALAKRGVSKGDRVALFTPNCPQFIVGYLAAHKLGAVAVPVNPLYSAREAAYQLNDCGAQVVIVLSRFYPLIRRIQRDTPLKHVLVSNVKEFFPFSLRTLYTLSGKEKSSGDKVDIDRSAGAEWFQDVLKEIPAGEKPSTPDTTPDDLGVLLYSGGTTGISKGAMLTHRNLVTNADQNRAWALVDYGCETSMVALPLFHAFGISCCLNLSLLTGSTMVLVPNPRDILNLMMAIQKFKTTTFPTVPTLMVAIAAHPQVKKYDLTSVRVCPCGGAALAGKIHQDILEKTGINAYEGYGLTEMSSVTIGNPPHAENRVGTIGMPYPSVDARIVSLTTGNVIDTFPEGEDWCEAGELEVKGPQMMKGYWQKSEAESPVKDGWLQTGDIAQMHRDGYFRIVDRKKDMIIRGGMNIYPTEIETVLYSHPKVSEAVVFGVPDDTRGELVKACVTIKSGMEATTEELRAYCKENLAKYKVPAFIEIRDTLPKSAIGKLLRRTLRDEAKDAASQKAEGAVPEAAPVPTAPAANDAAGNEAGAGNGGAAASA